MCTARPLEYCFVCEQPTGRAGQSEDSFYCTCDKGPFCEECWDAHHNADTKVANLLNALFEAASFGPKIPKEFHDIAMQAIAKAKETSR